MRFIRFIALVSLTGACGETHTPPMDDAGSGITFDAARADGGTDAGFDAHVDRMGIGDGCTGAADCPGFCITELPGGYCTATCESDEDCPESTACIGLGGGFSGCFLTCDPSSAERQCRMGYGCGASMFLPAPLCLPGCTDDTDCPMGLMCNPEGGSEGAGVCYDPSAMLGDPCTGTSDCPIGGSCLSEEASGIPGGTCGVVGCDIDGNTGCDGDAQCLPLRRRGLCVDGCTTDDDCRDGLACVPDATFPDRLFCGPGCRTDGDCSEGRVCNAVTGECAPMFDPSELGTACSTVDGACEGGGCLREVDSGFPGSYCVYVGCDPEMPAMSGCPGDGVCIPGASGAGLCLDGCETDMDCTRPGYACRPSDLADPESPTACRPACTDDAQCANPGFICNDGTGLCLEPFDPATLGDACADADGCAGGRCVTEAASGWPGGMCTFPGCRLTGMGPAETCPAASTCIDDGTGDPTLGVCVPTCTDTMCRVGYACTMDACRADCTPASCTDARTCDDASGLCSES